MFPFNHRGLKVFVYGKPIDMRSGFERLQSLVRQELTTDLLCGHVYLFLGRNHRRAKALFFDGTGLVLIHKRLETGRFMRADEFCETGTITLAELSLILDGSRIRLPLAAPPLAVPPLIQAAKGGG
jgi:transposase